MVVDHSARAGTGVADTETLHRIEEKVVIDEVRRAGSEFAATADFLRHGRGHARLERVPGFVLEFRKP